MNLETPSSEALSSSTWWSIVLRGLLAVAFGVVVLASPGPTASAMILVFAAYAFIDGLASLVAAVRRGRAGKPWSWFVFEGLASIVAGVVAFAYPAVTFLVLLLLVAVRAIVLGFLELGAALAGKGIDSRWLWALTGLLSIAFGVVMLSRPYAAGIAVVWMIGAYAIVAGIMTFAFGLHMRGIQRHLDEATHFGARTATT